MVLAGGNLTGPPVPWPAMRARTLRADTRRALVVSRLDQALVQRGQVQSRSRARRLILDGHVRVDGVVVTRPSQPVSGEQILDVDQELARFVGRGAEKLAHTIDAVGWDVRGRVALDVGASTGGFTQVLLDRGAAHVYAVDVGHGQLAAALVDHPDVTNMERTHAKDLGPHLVARPCAFVVADVSFISLTHLVAPIASVSTPHAQALLLVKPQFEAGPEHLDGTGVVRSATARALAVESVVNAATAAGWVALEVLPSPIVGGHGNREYFLRLSRDSYAEPRGLAQLTAVVRDDEG